MSSPSDAAALVELLGLAARLASPAERPGTARALARALGAEELLLFVDDPETGARLPGPGFPQTLPGFRAWRALLDRCAETGRAHGELTPPGGGPPGRAEAWAVGCEGVLVLLGGAPVPERVEPVRAVLSAAVAALRNEAAVAVAQAQAHVARGAAAQAQALSEALDLARRETQVLYGQVREALEFRDAFLAAAAHDLRTPLAAVTGFVQMLRRQADRGQLVLDERQRGALDQIETTGRRMRRLVDQLVDVARLQMGQALELARRPTDLVALARRVAAEHRLSGDRHTITVETAEPRLVGDWDTARLERVLDNLLGNAVKYSPAGGEVRLSLRRGPGGWAVVAVTDPGVGIPAAELPHVFERFRRASNTAGVVGTGIGLASVRQIVDEHRGAVEATSAEGVGSTFTVRVPGLHPSEQARPC